MLESVLSQSHKLYLKHWANGGEVPIGADFAEWAHVVFPLTGTDLLPVVQMGAKIKG